MALVFRQSENMTTYEVRSAGKSLRLYTNGVFHSQYHPDYLFNGGIWDALSLPAIFTPRHLEKILVLGVGGGTVIHQLAQLTSPVSIIGIDINAMHLKIAQKHFSLKHPCLKLIHGDAVAYTAASKNQFDMIVDDIFLEGENNPYRPVAQSGRWLELLSARLGENGILVRNHLSQREAASSLEQHGEYIQSSFLSGIEITVPCYENAIHVYCKNALTTRAARRAASVFTTTSLKKQDYTKLRYRLRKLFVNG